MSGSSVGRLISGTGWAAGRRLLPPPPPLPATEVPGEASPDCSSLGIACTDQKQPVVFLELWL